MKQTKSKQTLEKKNTYQTPPRETARQQTAKMQNSFNISPKRLIFTHSRSKAITSTFPATVLILKAWKGEKIPF